MGYIMVSFDVKVLFTNVPLKLLHNVFMVTKKSLLRSQDNK